MAMDFLAKPAHRLAQLYSKLMPIPCRLCGTACQHHPLCDNCIADLPKLSHACPRCAMPLSTSKVCGHCLNHPPEQQRSFSLFTYKTPIDRLIIDFKFHDKLYLSHFFAKKMAEQLRLSPLPELLIPIPLHPNRLRQRGYNQSLELTKDLSKQLNIPISNNILSRIIDTQSQSTIPFKQRKQNIQNAFQLLQEKPPKHIALIDDVLTTGHTANAAAKLLRKAGATTIEVWTIARTIGHD